MKRIREIKTICEGSSAEFDESIEYHLSLGYSIYGPPFSTGTSYNLMMVLLDDADDREMLTERVQ